MPLFCDSPERPLRRRPVNTPLRLPKRVFAAAAPTVTPPHPNFDVVRADWRAAHPRTALPKRRLLRTQSTDRFIPSRTGHGALLLLLNRRLEPPAMAPSALALPELHIRAATTKMYQHLVAEACGFELLRQPRILQFQPAPPERAPISLSRQLLALAEEPLKPLVVATRLRLLPTNPERVLDAPGIVDDFYLNVLSWLATNQLAVALDRAIYIWNANTGAVDLLAELEVPVSSLRWGDDGSYLSVGLDHGAIEVWDMETCARVRTMRPSRGTSKGRVAAQAWALHLIASGTRSGTVLHHDVRVLQHVVGTFNNHQAEVCGLEWRLDGTQWALGGNDNVVSIWDARHSAPVFSKHNHTAAVKALAWCPDQALLLASGGGSTDRKIHFWNSATGARVNTVDSGAQVLLLQWGLSKGVGREILATHGFPDNGVLVYAYPSMQKTGALPMAHELRILASALSPDGTTVCTVSGDENLKFWRVWEQRKEDRGSVLADVDRWSSIGKLR